MTDPPPGVDRRHLSKEDFYRSVRDDIDPMKLAGEGWFATEEYPRADDISDPFVRGDVGHEGEYFPPPKPRGRGPRTTP